MYVIYFMYLHMYSNRLYTPIYFKLCCANCAILGDCLIYYFVTKSPVPRCHNEKLTSVYSCISIYCTLLSEWCCQSTPGKHLVDRKKRSFAKPWLNTMYTPSVKNATCLVMDLLRLQEAGGIWTAVFQFEMRTEWSGRPPTEALDCAAAGRVF